MAVAYRCATGKGQCIDTALYESAFSFTESTVPAYERLGTVAKRSGSRLPGHTPINLYATRDGQHIHIAAAHQSLFRPLPLLLLRIFLLHHPLFSSPFSPSVIFVSL